MPRIFGHEYDEGAERLEVRFQHPEAGKVVCIYRNFAPEMYEAWRMENFSARRFFRSFMDEHDEEHLLHG